MPFSPFSDRRGFLKKLSTLLVPLAFPFRSRAAEKPFVLRFAVASDGHYGQPGTTYETDFQALTDALNAEQRTKGLDFCVFNGDLYHDKPEFLPQAKQAFDKLSSPYYVTRGNHDLVSKQTWQQTWGYSTNYAFKNNGYGIILLDTSNEEGKYLCADVAFLTQALKDFSSLKGIFVFMHISPRKWVKNGVDCPEVNVLIDQAPNVKAIFHGHDHDEDSKKTSDAGKNHFWSGHFGGNWGTPYKGYRIVEIKKDKSLHTFQFNMAEKKVVNADDFA